MHCGYVVRVIVLAACTDLVKLLLGLGLDLGGLCSLELDCPLDTPLHCVRCVQIVLLSSDTASHQP